jgi:hypothetical protein
MTTTTRRQIKRQIAELMRKAESGEQWAEICRLETLLNDGPWFGAERAS